jgi:hypothetical protein
MRKKNDFIMDYWHEVVESYDKPEIKDPKQKNDGTYSKQSVIILLMYLAFGKDYPYHIANFFYDLSVKKKNNLKTFGIGTLKHTGKIGTLLNKMKEDELVVSVADDETTRKDKPRKYYKINPRIIQSPVITGMYITSKGTQFEIPLKLIETFLEWMNKYHKEKSDKQNEEERKKAFMENFLNFEAAKDYIDFLTFLGKLSLKYEGIDHIPTQAVIDAIYEPSKEVTELALWQLITMYLLELDYTFDISPQKKAGYVVSVESIRAKGSRKLQFSD